MPCAEKPTGDLRGGTTTAWRGSMVPTQHREWLCSSTSGVLKGNIPSNFNCLGLQVSVSLLPHYGRTEVGRQNAAASSVLLLPPGLPAWDPVLLHWASRPQCTMQMELFEAFKKWCLRWLITVSWLIADASGHSCTYNSQTSLYLLKMRRKKKINFA